MFQAFVDGIEFVKTRLKKNAHNLHTNTRADYLTAIGLSHDPFAYQVAEQEIRFYDPFTPPANEEKLFSPLAYFVSPDYNGGTDISLLTELQTLRPSFVFGSTGTGKTLLKLALEATCRRQHDHTLVVTFSRLDGLLPGGRGVRNRRKANLYWDYLARDLATDLLLQVIEQYDFHSRLPDDTQTKAMAQLLQFAGRGLWRLVDKLIELEEAPDDRYGLGAYWGSVKRFPVHYVIWSPRLRQWLMQLKRYEHTMDAAQGEDAFRQGVAAAAVWGFEYIFVLVDDIHNWRRPADDMVKLINPLLQTAASWNEKGVVFKFFLTDDLRPHIEVWRKQPQNQILQPLLIDLNWSHKKLRELLRARFRAAGSLRVGFGDLVEPELGEEIDEKLITRANGSPRVLLSVINKLIDNYLDSASDDLVITRQDWERTYRLSRPARPQPPERSPYPAERRGAQVF